MGPILAGSFVCPGCTTLPERLRLKRPARRVPNPCPNIGRHDLRQTDSSAATASPPRPRTHSKRLIAKLQELRHTVTRQEAAA